MRFYKDFVRGWGALYWVPKTNWKPGRRLPLLRNWGFFFLGILKIVSCLQCSGPQSHSLVRAIHIGCKSKQIFWELIPGKMRSSSGFFASTYSTFNKLRSFTFWWTGVAGSTIRSHDFSTKMPALPSSISSIVLLRTLKLRYREYTHYSFKMLIGLDSGFVRSVEYLGELAQLLRGLLRTQRIEDSHIRCSMKVTSNIWITLRLTFSRLV